MKRFAVLLLSLATLAAFSGCTTRKVVIVETEKPAPPPAKNKGQAIASQKHVDNGLKQLNKGHYKQATEQFRLAIDKDPRNWEAYFYLGLTYQRWKKYNDSIEHFRLAIEYNSGDKVWLSRVRLHIGISLEYIGRYRDAEREYQMAMTLNPKNKEASERWERVSKKVKSKEKKDRDDDEREYGVKRG